MSRETAVGAEQRALQNRRHVHGDVMLRCEYNHYKLANRLTLQHRNAEDLDTLIAAKVRERNKFKMCILDIYATASTCAPINNTSHFNCYFCA